MSMDDLDGLFSELGNVAAATGAEEVHNSSTAGRDGGLRIERRSKSPNASGGAADTSAQFHGAGGPGAAGRSAAASYQMKTTPSSSTQTRSGAGPTASYGSAAPSSYSYGGSSAMGANNAHFMETNSGYVHSVVKTEIGSLCFFVGMRRRRSQAEVIAAVC